MTTIQESVPTVETPVAQPQDGRVLRAYRWGLGTIEDAGITVGGASLGALSHLGLPDSATKSLVDEQANVMHGVSRWSDDVGTKAVHAVGKGVHIIREGLTKGANMGGALVMSGVKSVKP